MKTLEELEAALSPHARHAYEAYKIAFDRDSAWTIRQIRDAILVIYGPEVDKELSDHLEARVRAVIPSHV